jgi:hypothetical protein
MMPSRTREIYSSPNGDRWFLALDKDSGRVYVKHIANPSSGGQETDIDIDAFLGRQRGSPERQALMHLIGTLTEDQDV